MRVRFFAADRDPGVRRAVGRVLDSGRFVLGAEVAAFEQSFAAFLGVPHAVGVASGTDAITLALAAVGIGPGDRVLTSAFSTGYTPLGILRAGATPVFGEVEPESLCLAAEAVERAGDLAAVVPVHLYGGAGASWEALLDAAARRGVPVIEDACQAHGARFRGRALGSFGAAAAFSFYPTKNLGALGDGGLVATGDAGIAERVRRLRLGGQQRRHDHAEPGWNSRLDEIQAAVLSHRLPALDEENRTRRRLAAHYQRALAGLPLTFVPPGRGVESACHLFVIRTPARDALRESLAADGIETLIHYPLALPDQRAFPGAACPEARRAAAEVLSLPLHPELRDEEADAVAVAVRRFFGVRIREWPPG